MKSSFVFSILVLLLLCTFGNAQVRISGYLQSSLYSWENLKENQFWDYYQGFQFRIQPAASNAYLTTYFRLAHRGDPADWEEKFYNLYFHWNTPGKKFQFRLGRQFLYHGVLNGTMDGVLLNFKPSTRLNFKLVSGIPADLHRRLRVQKWNDAHLWGGYVAYRFNPQTRFDMSYIQKQRHGKTVWHLVGAGLSGKFHQTVFYQALLDYNIEKSDYQGFRGRLTYYYRKWLFSAEINSQRPRIYEDSYFRIFDVSAFNQFRTAIGYRFKKFQVGIQYLYTIYEESNNNSNIILTVDSPWGTVGLVYQNGFGGDNIGIYGNVRYDLIRGVTFFANSSYYNYQRHTISISEDATSFSAGFLFKPFRILQARAEVQQSINSFYKNDVRGLFQINYFFNY